MVLANNNLELSKMLGVVASEVCLPCMCGGLKIIFFNAEGAGVGLHVHRRDEGWGRGSTQSQPHVVHCSLS